MTRFLRDASVVLGLILLASTTPVAAQDSAQEVASFDSTASLAASLVRAIDAEPASEVSGASLEPSVPRDLARRETPDVPLFVGPAELKVAGDSGAYRWDSISFGAQQVKAKVVLVPDGEPCAIRLRLVSDDGPIIDETYGTDAAARTTHRLVLDVDYATAAQKVDSDCAGWSVRLKPIEDPDLKVEIKERSYTVRGNTIAELEQGTRRIDGEWAAFANWHTRWAYRWVEDAASCRITSGLTELVVTVRMPKWKRPKRVDRAVVEEWDRVYRNLLVHELGHVTIALQGADAIDDALDVGFSAKTCQQVSGKADAKASRIFERYNRASRRYDNETEHGRTQGTWFRGL